MPTIPPVVPQASVSVSDDLLQQAITAAAAFEAGQPETLDEAAQALFLHVAGPAMRELLQWRQRVGIIRDLADGSNLILFSGNLGKVG